MFQDAGLTESKGVMYYIKVLKISKNPLEIFSKKISYCMYRVHCTLSPFCTQIFQIIESLGQGKKFVNNREFTEIVQKKG